MSTTNTPSGSIETKNISGSRRVNLSPLLKKSVKAELGVGGIINPTRYPLRKKGDAIQDIRDKIKSIRDSDDTWSETTNEAIFEMKDSEILGEIEIFASGLRNARRLAPVRFFGAFPGLRDILSTTELSGELMKLDENELSSLYSSRTKMKKYLKTEHSISADILEKDMYDFREIFGSENLKEKNPTLYKKLEYAALSYKNSGTQPPKSLIKELLGFYSSDTLKKDDIYKYFSLTFTLPEALRGDIVSSDTPRKIAEKEFPHIWNDLEGETQEKLISTIRTDDTVEITIDDRDTPLQKEKINQKDMEDIITDKIFRRASVLENSGRTTEQEDTLSMDSEGKVHSSWLESIASSEVSKKIPNIGLWTEGKVLAFEDRNGGNQYFQLQKSDIDVGNLMNPGVRLASLAGLKAGSIGLAKGESDISYTDLSEYLRNGVKLGEIMSENELRSRATKEKSEAVDEGGVIGLKADEKIWDMSESEDMMTETALIDAINRIDPEGKKISDGKIGIGLSFVSKSAPDEHGMAIEGVYTIKKIGDGLITISGSGEGDETVNYRDFIETIDKQGLKRIALLDPEQEDASMLQALGKYGVDTDHTTLSDGSLTTETTKEVDDGHGHHTSEKTLGKYEFFEAKKGGHIRFAGMKDGFVYFGEYDGGNKIEDVRKAKKAKKLSEKAEKGLYRWRTMSYGAFLHYLDKEEMTATTDNLLDPHASHIHDPHEHFEGSLFSRIGKLYSISDIMKGFQNFGHHVEHYFEKTSKLNASRVTLALAKKLPENFGADLIAQAQSEEVTSVKEIIDKLKDKLGNLNGPHGRTKALHIAHNKDARPEEVAAAMLYMVRGYGHLYAEDIAYAEGSHSFINGFLNACGFKDEASRKAMKQKARDKFMSDMGTENSDITEEELIWGFMKTMDGKYNEYPVAATVVKSLGGPSGWEKVWRTEGFDGAYEKGIRQGADTVNAKGRVNKGLSALVTHEYHTAIGFMEKAAGKSPDPSIQTIPVVWALAGYSQYIGTKASQKVKGYGDSMGHTFHAYAFLRNHGDNLVFRNAFRLALQDIAPQEVEKLDGYIKTLQRKDHHHSEDNDDAKEAVSGIAKIWDSYQAKGLHDALQGKNGWLIEKVNAGNTDAKKYLSTLDGIHMMNGSENPPPDNDWMIQYGYDGSPLIEKKELDGKTVLSLERTLKKIRINSHSYDMDKDRQARLWPSVIARMDALKKISDPELRQVQYNQYRQDILTWFRNAINTRGASESAMGDLKKKSYYKDLLAMGIDPGLIVEGGETEKVIRTTSGEDYTMWTGGGRGAGNYRHETVQEIIDDTSDKARKRVYQQGEVSAEAPYREESTMNTAGDYVLQSEDSD